MKSFPLRTTLLLLGAILLTSNANGQILPMRSPSVLSYAPQSGRYSVARPSAYGNQRYTAPSYAGRTFGATYGYPATPWNLPSQNPYNPNAYNTGPRHRPFIQANDGQHSVMLNGGDLIGEPPLAAPPAHVVPQAATPPLAIQPMQPSCGGAYGGTCYPSGGTGFGLASYVNADDWFITKSTLWMTRDHGDHYTFSFGTGNEALQLTNTRDAAMDWSGGLDVRFGRYFNCGRNAIEVGYWGLFPDNESTQTTSADVVGDLNGILNWSNLDYGAGTGADIVNVAPGNDGVHAVFRDFEVHNVEVNLWQFGTGITTGGSCGSGSCGAGAYGGGAYGLGCGGASQCGGACGGSKCGVKSCGGPQLRFNMLAGIRFFKFQENLLFGADANDFDIDFEDDEIFYNIDIDNNLIGFQIGAEAQYCFHEKWTLNLGTKLGLYGNHISHISEIGGGQGVAVINGGGPNSGREFFVDNNKTDVAFLGEMNLGLEYCINCNWSVALGYRALAATGVALPAEQIYADLRGINDVEIVDSNGSLILHGGYLGAECNW
jgi:hypothetical protein